MKDEQALLKTHNEELKNKINILFESWKTLNYITELPKYLGLEYLILSQLLPKVGKVLFSIAPERSGISFGLGEVEAVLGCDWLRQCSS